MSAAKRHGGAKILLPWERRGTWLSERGIVRGWRTLLLLCAAVAAVIAAFRAAEANSRLRATRAAIAETKRAVAAFRAEMERCPKSKTELIHPPRAGAQYLTESPVDGWGRELLVRCPAPDDPTSAEVISAGPSGSFSVDDNVF